jgi:hypothetical protein
MQSHRKRRGAAAHDLGRLAIAQLIPRDEQQHLTISLTKVRERPFQTDVYGRRTRRWRRVGLRREKLTGRGAPVPAAEMVCADAPRHAQQPRQRIAGDLVLATPSNEERIRDDVFNRRFLNTPHHIPIHSQMVCPKQALEGEAIFAHNYQLSGTGQQLQQLHGLRERPANIRCGSG